MRNHSLALICFGLLGLAGAGLGITGGHGAGVGAAPAVLAGRNIAASDPMLYATGTPLTQSAEGTTFYYDFQQGTYRFTVQPYGTWTNYVNILQLSPGMGT